ncbi:hypothetical protein RCL1_002448 [Eukaryota sp. TZLM3-RCL]
MLGLPTLLIDILTPPHCPENILFYFESARVHHSCGRYQEAVTTLERAKECWLQTVTDQHSSGDNSLSYVPNELFPEAEIYFSYQISLSLIAGNLFPDKLNFFIDRCFSFAERLPPANPDSSLGYTLRGIFYFTVKRDYYQSLLAFSESKIIKERILGISPVDLATAYNNLGCSLLMESVYVVDGCKLISEAFNLLRNSLGINHPKTQIALKNVSVSRTVPLVNGVELPVIPKPKAEDASDGKKKKGKKGSKKGKKGGKKKKK